MSALYLVIWERHTREVEVSGPFTPVALAAWLEQPYNDPKRIVRMRDVWRCPAQAVEIVDVVVQGSPDA